MPQRLWRRRRLRASCGAAIALGISVLAAVPAGTAARRQAPVPGTTLDVEAIGPKVGEALPEFSLADQCGRLTPLKSLLGPNGAVIVFFRSADW